jgi:hypothetical protein
MARMASLSPTKLNGVLDMGVGFNQSKKKAKFLVLANVNLIRNDNNILNARFYSPSYESLDNAYESEQSDYDSEEEDSEIFEENENEDEDEPFPNIIEENEGNH